MITTETSQNHVIAAIQAGAQGDILQPFTRETFEAKGAIVWREERARYMGGKAHACWDVSHSIWTAFHGVNAAIKLHIMPAGHSGGRGWHAGSGGRPGVNPDPHVEGLRRRAL